MANISISGGTSPTVAVYGKNLLVAAGIGSDSVGATATLGKLANISVNSLGNDTINVGSGLDTIVQSGQATVTSAFTTLLGSSSVTGGTLSGITSSVQAQLATVIGGALQTPSSGLISNALTDVQGVLSGTTQTAGVTVSNALQDVQGVAQGPPAILAATLNNAGIDVQTLVSNTTQTGGVTVSNALQDVQGVAQGPPAIVGATSQNVVAQVGGVFSGLKATIHATTGATGADSLTGGASPVSTILGSQVVGDNAITNFVSANPMSVDGYSLSYLQAHHDISSQGGNTYISIDGGKSSIELKGISGLTNSESVLHKN